ncbi:MAG: glycosyltransferase family 2 protein [Rhodobacter sp.]|nr:glycosyltransferase family 2 protein [Rhodobacter sp.]
MGMLIISLSSIPPRFARIGPTLQSLIRQSDKADRIYLYIPNSYRRFPDWDGKLPEVPEGVEIRRVDEDLGPATKVLFAAREFAGEDVDILFCDDDRYYPADTVARFKALRARHPGCAIALVGRQAETMSESTGRRENLPRAVRRWRITDVEFQLKFLWHQIRAGRNWRSVGAPHRKVYKRSGYIDIFEGCGGVLVRPEYFDDLAYDIPPVLWTVDDVWLSGMVARNGVPIWLQANLADPPETEADSHSPLAFSVIEGADRDTANAMAVRYMQDNFGIWP